MNLETSEKKLLVDINDQITIRKVRNPFTDKATLLVNNEYTHQAFITDDITINGIKLVVQQYPHNAIDCLKTQICCSPC
jgi:hypothetical protein